MNFLITGDCHGDFSRFKYLGAMPNTAIIILGDVGLNFNLDERDHKRKMELSSYPFTFYCVRGNHEARPSEKLGMHRIHDENVDGAVWIEDEFPTIRYFCDWGHYNIDGLKTLVIGGAYSVDKHYRIASKMPWFEDEQLAQREMETCERNIEPFGFDLVLSHTCPRSVQPTDLFLSFIDQSAVDSSMEEWMDRIARTMKWKLWLFAHYHADRIEWPHVEQFYMEIEPLNDILERWANYDKTGELDWWLPISTKMARLMEGEKNV